MELFWYTIVCIQGHHNHYCNISMLDPQLRWAAVEEVPSNKGYPLNNLYDFITVLARSVFRIPIIIDAVAEQYGVMLLPKDVQNIFIHLGFTRKIAEDANTFISTLKADCGDGGFLRFDVGTNDILENACWATREMKGNLLKYGQLCIFDTTFKT